MLSVGFFFFFCCFALILWWLLLCFALFALFALLNCSAAEGRHVSLSVSSAVTSHMCRGKDEQPATTMSNFVVVSPGRIRVWVRLWLCGELVVNLPCSGRMSSPQNLLGVGFLRYSYTVVSQLGGSSTLLLSLSLPL